MRGRDNDTLAKDIITNAFDRVKIDHERRLAAARDLALSDGYYLGSRFGVLIQDEIILSLRKLGGEIIEFLGSLDPDFSPFKTNHYNLAKPALYRMRNELYRDYENQKGLGKVSERKLAPLDRERIQLECDKILNSLEISRKTLLAQRSILRWALGNTKRRFFSFALASFGALLTHVIKLILNRLPVSF